MTSPCNDVAALGKFSNVLVVRSIRMIPAKNYETVSKSVKVMPRILWPLFSRHGALLSTIMSVY